MPQIDFYPVLVPFAFTNRATPRVWYQALYPGHFEETQFSRWVHLMDDKWDVIEMTPQTDYRKRLSADVRTNVTNATDPFSECYFVPSGVEVLQRTT